MAMGDALRSMFAGDREIYGRGKSNVPVNDGAVMARKERLAGAPIDWVVGNVVAGDCEHTAAKLADLLVIIVSAHLIDEEIKLDALAVDVSVEIHDERFGAAAIHGTDDVEDTEGL